VNHEIVNHETGTVIHETVIVIHENVKLLTSSIHILQQIHQIARRHFLRVLV
jgi:hypothetical protein